MPTSPTLSERAERAAGAFAGFKVVVSPHLAEWRAVQVSRSPSRAARRIKRGFRQNIRFIPQAQAYQMGDTLFVSPAYWDALRARAAGGDDGR